MSRAFDSKKVKHLFFDLGAVLLNIDLSRFTQRIQELIKTREFGLTHEKLPFYAAFEKGELEESEFFELMQRQVGKSVDISDLKKAWSLILLNPNLPGWNFLKEMRHAGYRTYLLSNTNPSHRKQFDKIFDEELGPNQFYKSFEEVYYSHELGLIKPDPEIFHKTCKLANVQAQDCFFIDDKLENVQAAASCGWQAWHFTGNNDWVKMAKMLL